MISSPDAIEKLFLKGTLAKLCSEGQDPTYSSIDLLQNELISNAVSVRSNLGDGVTGHLFLVVSDTDYQKATIGNLSKPNAPNKPNAPTLPTTNSVASTRSGTTSTTANISTEHELYKVQYRTYQEDLDNYLLYFNTSKCLVK